MQTASLTLPAYAADTLGETITLTVPADRVSQVKALARFLPYGHEFNRAVLDQLITCSRITRHGYLDGATERIDKLTSHYLRTGGS